MRRAVEAIFEMQNGGTRTLHQWLMRERLAGKSLRQIATEVEHMTGVKVSHQTVANWIVEG